MTLHGTPRVLKYGVRSDQVDFLEKELNGTFSYDHGAFGPLAGVVNGSGSVGGTFDVANLPQDGNISHFWDRGSDLLDGTKRDGVSQYLDDLQRDHYPTQYSIWIP